MVRRAVIDQPGLKIIVLGLLLSIFLGLAIRSQMTQSKINEHLKRAIHVFEQKNNKFSIEFGEASLLLSDWGLPFPHLQIKNIKVSSSAAQCVDNQIFIESLDIPISWINLLTGAENKIDTIRAGVVELHIDHLDQCVVDHKNETQTELKNTAKSEVKLIQSENHLIQQSEREKSIQLFIDKLKIVDKHNYNIPLLLQNVTVKIETDQNKLKTIDLKSQLYLFRDRESSLYKFRSEFNFYYELKPNGEFESSATIHGKLIDKPFEMDLVYDPASKKIMIKHVVRDLSVKALLSLVNTSSDRNQNQFDGISGLSLSNQGHGEYNLVSRTLEFYDISDVVLSSGSSRISVDLIKLDSIKPLVFKPFKIIMNQFDLEKIKNIPALAGIQKSIYDFGKISGSINIKSQKDFSIQGRIEDLQFIFSNRGQRAYQKITELKFQLTPEVFVIGGISLDDHLATGELKIQFDSQSEHLFSPINAEAEISDIKLNESIYQIFGFSQVKPTLISLSLHNIDNKIHSKLRFDQLVSPALELKQLEVSYTADKSLMDRRSLNSTIDMNVKNLKITRSDQLDESFYSILEKLDSSIDISEVQRPTDFYFDVVKAKYSKKDNGDVQINMNANYFSILRNEKNKLSIKGAFANPKNSVFEIELLNRQKSIQKFSVNADLSQFIFDIKK